MFAQLSVGWQVAMLTGEVVLHVAHDEFDACAGTEAAGLLIAC